MKVTGRVLKETDFGIFFITKTKAVWLPKGNLSGERPASECGLVSYLIPNWLAERKGLR